MFFWMPCERYESIGARANDASRFSNSTEPGDSVQQNVWNNLCYPLSTKMKLTVLLTIKLTHLINEKKPAYTNIDSNRVL